MDNREIRAAADRADWQVILGVTAGCGLVALRLFAVAVLVLGEPANYLLALGALGETCLCVFLVWRLSRGSLVAAYTLLMIWLLGLGYAWFTSESGIPPFFLVSLLIAVGLVQGILGIHARRRAATAALLLDER